MITPRTRGRLLVLLVVVLLITNIAMLIFFVFLKPDPRNRGGRGDYVVEYLKDKVGFDTTQIAQFKALREKHNTNMQPYFTQIRADKDKLYKNLYKGNALPDSVLYPLTDSIGRDQAVIERALFKHFNEIRSICTPEQQPAFDSLLTRLFRRMPGGNGGPPPKWKENR
ncbi:hypothetical protein LX64_01583 [Chitinophaga skermanii]|uniref:Heavy-metal resistance protein n=1 Tax=Chitinophaga skermanii TaxID=331697 RepID=A0A327QYU1_9BACT|nr:hypothetical protein [Chitinophaga skermanii]RAJ08928.1 hypothetical protein LX64_01583 [Chitinophaga skermanii]